MQKNQFAIMRTVTNLVFLILFLICGPVFMYYMYTKTYAPDTFQKKPTSLDYQKKLQEKTNENQRLHKELEELKKHMERPLAQPAWRFGQGGRSTNPSSKSPLSQPPRRMGQPPTPSESGQHHEDESKHRQIQPTDLLNE